MVDPTVVSAGTVVVVVEVVLEEVVGEVKSTSISPSLSGPPGTRSASSRARCWISVGSHPSAATRMSRSLLARSRSMRSSGHSPRSLNSASRVPSSTRISELRNDTVSAPTLSHLSATIVVVVDEVGVVGPVDVDELQAANTKTATVSAAILSTRRGYPRNPETSIQ